MIFTIFFTHYQMQNRIKNDSLHAICNVVGMLTQEIGNVSPLHLETVVLYTTLNSCQCYIRERLRQKLTRFSHFIAY